MFTKSLKITFIGLIVALNLPFTSLYSQDCTDANSVEFITDCGTEFTLCVDKGKTEINVPINISIFSNDDLGILQMCNVAISIQALNGTAEILDDCQMKYTPDLDYVGLDSFYYKFDFWDTCTEPYCEEGLYIWDITSYYTGPDNVSLEVFSGDIKIGSEALLNNGDLFTIDGTKLTNAENEEWRYVFYNNVCLDAEEHCKVINFDEQDRGRIMNTQYLAEGVTISAENDGGGPDLAIIFDSGNPTGNDPDLGTPNQAFGGPGVGVGGGPGSPGRNEFPLSNVLIIAEDDEGSSDGTVDDPDDEAGGGLIVFTFDQPVTVNDMKILDLENGESDVIRCFDASGGLLSSIDISGEGDNSVIVQQVNVSDVSRMEIDFQSSGALDEISYCRPYDCLNKEVAVATKCPASEDVFGMEQGGMFRPLSGCVAPNGLECRGDAFRAPTQVSVLQTAETKVVILIESSLLPIEFGSITGRAIGANNQIAWDVVEVIDERYMFLEKSNDGRKFDEISKFGDLEAGEFVAKDKNVNSEVTYYRIKSISNNGYLTYSRTITVRNKLATDSEVDIFPQPASDDLHFTAKRNIRTIELLDLTGKRISYSLVDDVSYTIQLDDAQSAGVYIARILMDNGSVRSIKVVVK